MGYTGEVKANGYYKMKFVKKQFNSTLSRQKLKDKIDPCNFRN